MKAGGIVSESLSILDEVFKNEERQNFVGTLITGIGLTIAALGIGILKNKPRNDVSESEQNEEKTE